MGHRALVAYERTDGLYTLHYSHWGGADLKLKHRITAETPFGGENTDSKWAKQLLAELTDGLEAVVVAGHLQGQFQALRGVAGDMMDKEAFTQSTARRYLKQKLCEWVRE